jgi:hypothetical protein
MENKDVKAWLKENAWHEPNCPGWHRCCDRDGRDGAEFNAPYPHLVEMFGDKYECRCGFDEIIVPFMNG